MQLGHEDRSQSESRSRCQVSSTTTASTGGKKHKISKAEEGKPLSEFENLFGPPIHNVPAKRSPATTSTDSHKTQVNNIDDYYYYYKSDAFAVMNFKYSNVHPFSFKIEIVV